MSSLTDEDIVLDFETAKDEFIQTFSEFISYGEIEFKEINNRVVSLSDNNKAFFGEYSTKMDIEDIEDGEEQARFYLMFTFVDNRVIVVTAMGLEENWEDNKLLLEQALLSLVPLGEENNSDTDNGDLAYITAK